MSAQGVGALHFVDGMINAEKYQEVLQSHLMPSIPPLSSEFGEFIYQQDGASCHTARSTKQWLVDNEIPLLEWPSGSPDLSPIETLWGNMKKYLKKNPTASKQLLKVRLEEIWSAVTPEYCQKLVRTMPQRIKAVIERKGDVTNW